MCAEEIRRERKRSKKGDKQDKDGNLSGSNWSRTKAEHGDKRGNDQQEILPGRVRERHQATTKTQRDHEKARGTAENKPETSKPSENAGLKEE